jgi:hypothetical protein
LGKYLQRFIASRFGSELLLAAALVVHGITAFCVESAPNVKTAQIVRPIKAKAAIELRIGSSSLVATARDIHCQQQTAVAA